MIILTHVKRPPSKKRERESESERYRKIEIVERTKASGLQRRAEKKLLEATEREVWMNRVPRQGARA